MNKVIRNSVIVIAIFAAYMHFRKPPGGGVKPGANLGAAIPARLLDSNGNDVSSTSLKGKYVGVYFSAHWCPPCRSFTPALVKFRNANVANNFEIVFVSADHSLQEKEQYIRETNMKWLSVPGAHGPEHSKLEQQFETPGYPTLIILSPNGTVVSNSGVADVMMTPSKALAKWKAAGS